MVTSETTAGEACVDLRSIGSGELLGADTNTALGGLHRKALMSVR